jgi:hypothetical protein
MLSETLLDCQDPQISNLKRKPGVDVDEKEGGKRKCVQRCSQVVPLDTLD